MTEGPGEPLALKLPPALTIEIDIGAACEIKVTGNGQQESLVNEGFSKNDLGTLRLEVKERLGEFSNRLTPPITAKDPRVSVREGMVALCELQKLGYWVLLQLMGKDHREKLPKIVELARSACSGLGRNDKWSAPKWGAKPARRPKLVVFKTSAKDGIPIDILPLLDPYPDKSAISEELDQLGKLACCFLGFSAIVKREIGEATGNPRRLENIPKLPVKMFINRSLRGARQEEVTLRNAHIDIDPGWPSDSNPSQADFADILATHLWEVGTRFGRTRGEFPDQICHFACHSNTDVNRLPMNYEIGLQGQRLMGERKVTLQDLTVALSILSEKNSNDPRPRPLIFMNSCGSGDLDPQGAASFQDLFLKRKLGFIGFIGTETVMPDDFAAEFSRVFYDKLIRGSTVGQSILRARWDLLKTYHNPLGLMYALFAAPEIHVRRPVRQPSVQVANGGISSFFASLRRKFGSQGPLAY
jgi:hypothetical protein